MWTFLGSIFAASLIGSLHCVGMCGGFVAFYAGDPNQRAGGGPAHLAYHGGRLLTYVTLGLLAGTLGAGLNKLGGFVGFQHTAMLLGGGLLILWGIVMLAQQSGALTQKTRLPVWFQRTVYRLYRSLQEQPSHRRALYLGLLTTIMPCGWLYAFVMSAASTGRPLSGALVMFAFWLGTVPALLSLGLGVRGLSLSLGRWVPRLSAVSLIVVGLLALWPRARALILPQQQHHHHHHQAAPTLRANTQTDPDTRQRPCLQQGTPAPSKRRTSPSPPSRRVPALPPKDRRTTSQRKDPAMPSTWAIQTPNAP